MIPAEIRRYAEDPNAYGPEPHAPVARILTDRYVLFLGAVPSLTVVARLRLGAADVAATLAEVRAHVADRGHRDATWWVGSSATPRDLVSRLIAHGLRPDDRPGFEPRATAMATTTPPPAVPAGVTARRVETFAEYELASRVSGAGFGIPEAELREWAAVARERWEAEQAGHAPRTYLAWVDGEPAAVGRMLMGPRAGFLIGGATVPAARRRGAYRALVRARWDDASAAGRAALVTQAGAMSRPILERFGFERVADLEILVDPGVP